MKDFIRNLKSNTFVFYMSMVCKIITTVCISAILFVVVGHFVPELRELMPDVYSIVEWCLSGFLNGMAKSLTNLASIIF